MLRTIITQDAEVDDQNSLRHILLYANDIEIQGIVQTHPSFIGKDNQERLDQVIRLIMISLIAGLA